MGVLYLSNKDFLINGVPASIVATLVSSDSLFLSSAGGAQWMEGRSDSLV